MSYFLFLFCCIEDFLNFYIMEFINIFLYGVCFFVLCFMFKQTFPTRQGFK